MDKKFINVICEKCSHENLIPVSRLYDGFEGVFTCQKCKNALDNLHDIIDD